ncbi:MAG TPA: hypothetical protein VHF27_07175 [Acidimicrobiales bacterium]|nr:hypothetical protein [Acidimicrobiales bacterium]
MSSQEQPEENQADDEATSDGAADAQADDGQAEGGSDADDSREDEQKPPTEDERLEQLDDRIGKARSQAEEAGILEGEDATADDERKEPETDDHGEREFAESGATEQEDDQTIAPPG